MIGGLRDGTTRQNVHLEGLERGGFKRFGDGAHGPAQAMQLPFTLPARIRAGLFLAGEVVEYPRVQPGRLLGLLAGPAGQRVHHGRSQVGAKPALADVVFKTVQGLEQVHLDFLHDVLGVGVARPPAAGVAVKQLAVALVELLPTELVRPIAQPHQESQMRRIGFAHHRPFWQIRGALTT